MPFEQFNLGQSMRTGEAIKSARAGNALADLTLQNTKQMNALAPQIAAGDEQAVRQGAALDPRKTSEIIDAVAKMPAAERERVKEFYADLGKGAAWATTEPKWNSLIDTLNRENKTTHFEQYRGQFQNREMFINRIREVENILGGEGKDFTLSPGQTRFNPTGKTIASVPRDPNSGPGAITPTQSSNNAEIDTARKFWQNLVDQKYGGDARAMINEVFTLDPITRGLVPKDKALADMWTKARNRKVGDDTDFEPFVGQFMPGAPQRQDAEAPQGLPPKLKERADRGEPFTEQELRQLYETDTDAFAALRAYLEQQGR